MSKTKPIVLEELPESEKLSPAQLLELKKWWDAFGSKNTPLAIMKMANETLELRKAADELRKQTVLMPALESFVRMAMSPERDSCDQYHRWHGKLKEKGWEILKLLHGPGMGHGHQ